MNDSELFEMLARMTWRTLERASRNRIQYGEDAITSVNLNAMASSNRLGIVVEDTRVNEASKGCDFEFWIGNNAGGWARYAIQAKKLNHSTSSYIKLGHKVRGQLQMDILENYATVNRAAALYCFYNHSQSHHGWNCGLQTDSAQLGCSVVPVAVVRALMQQRGARSFASVHSHRATLPWRCLIRCPRLASSPALRHQDWPPTESYIHQTLPSSLQALLQSRKKGNISIDSIDTSNYESGSHAGWVGIFEVSAAA